MKTFTLTLFLVFASFFLLAQEWVSYIPEDRRNADDLNIKEVQQAFNQWCAENNIVEGYIDINGQKEKEPAYKQFKRWEWKAQYLTDGEGYFYQTTTSEQMEQFLKTYDDSKSIIGNWTNIGYNTTPGGYDGVGRVNCIAFHPTNNSIIWLGTPSGGMWKTSNGGATWTPLTDNNTVLGVSAIAVPSNYASSNTLYIGTGDRDTGSGWSLGGGNTHDNESIGVLKSTDGGNTWTTCLSFTPSQQILIYDLVIDPNNSSKIYAATTNGVYYSFNAGSTWSPLNATAVTDLEFHPSNSNVLYGAYYRWMMKYTWNGSYWSSSVTTITSNNIVRSEIAVTAASSNLVYAILSGTGGVLDGIYTSTNSGASFSLTYDGTTGSSNLLGYPCDGTGTTGLGYYDLFITANPSNANDVYIGGINVWHSTDGGSTWSICSHWNSNCGTLNVTEVHCDQHCCEFQNSSTIFLGNDGGIYRTTDAGSTWIDLSNSLTINQIYRMGNASQASNEILIGLQDNGTHLYTGGSWVSNAVLGADGMECTVDPGNINNQLAEYQYGQIIRCTDHWSQNWTWIDVRNNIRASAGNYSITGDWATPFMLDPNNNNHLYVGYDELWRSTDQGATSTNFTKLTNFNNSSNKIKSLAIAPSNSNYIYLAFLTNMVKSTDGGSTWNNITSGLPVSSGNITDIEVKYDDPNTVWVTIGGFNNHAVYQTTNGGTTWSNISTGLPQIPAMSIVQNKYNSGKVELYVAMSQGVWIKSGTANWSMFKNGLPNVFCTELEIYYDQSNRSNSKIRVATFGRGIWETPLPVVDFTASNTMPPNAMTTVNFTDLSTNSPTSWFWSFSPGTVGFVGGTNAYSQNPSVVFTSPGAYSVSLTTGNIFGSDNHTKTAYIHMGTPGLWTGATSSVWSTSTNWENHLTPVSTDNVAINPGAPNWPTYSGNLSLGTDCNTINIVGPANLTVTGDLSVPFGKLLNCTNAPTIYIGGDFNNLGTFQAANSMIDLYGTADASVTANSSQAGSQTTTYAAGYSPFVGCYFDVLASAGSTITIDSFDIHCSSTGPVFIDVYYCNGSYLGNINNPAAWTQMGSTQSVTGQGYNNPTTVNPGATLNILPGNSNGFYISCYSGGTGYFIFSGGNNTYVNSDLTVMCGDVGWTVTPGNGSYAGYTFNGTVYYTATLSNTLSFYDMKVSKSNAKVTVNGTLSVGNDLTIEPGARLTNPTSNNIAVGGNLSLFGNSSGMASLVDNGMITVSGTSFQQKYYTDNRWHNVSSSLSNVLSGIFSGLYLYEFDETSFSWTNIYSMNQLLNPGQGYLIWSTVGNPTISYTGGNLNTGNLTATLSYTDQNNNSTVDANEGWNMMGNPYASAIDIRDNGFTWTSLTNTIYMYNGSQYVTYNRLTGVGNPSGTSQYVPSLQGFFVKVSATSPAPALVFPNAARLHHTQQNYKASFADEIRVQLKDDIYVDELVILGIPGSNEGFDDAFDAYKLYGPEAVPHIYTLVEDVKMSVNCFDQIDHHTLIPVYIEVPEEGIYILNIDKLMLGGINEPAYLHDLYSEIWYEIKEGSSIPFTMVDLNDMHRFNLQFNKPDGIDQIVSDKIRVYAYGSRIFIENDNLSEVLVEVYSMLGECIISHEFDDSKCQLSLTHSSGTYLVKVVSEGIIQTEKVFILQ